MLLNARGIEEIQEGVKGSYLVVPTGPKSGLENWQRFLPSSCCLSQIEYIFAIPIGSFYNFPIHYAMHITFPN